MNRRWPLVILAFTIAILAYFLPDWLKLGQQPWLTRDLVFLVFAVSEFLVFGLPALLIMKSGGQGPGEAWREKPDAYQVGLTAFSGVSGILAGSLVAALFYSLLTALGLQPPLREPVMPQTPLQFALALFSVGLVTAVSEELFFRRALPDLLSRWLPPRAVIQVSSLLFALMHADLAGFPVYYLFGLMMHRLCRRSNSLWLPVIFHAVYNASLLVVSYAGAQPDLMMHILAAALFALSTWLLLKEERHETHDPGL